MDSLLPYYEEELGFLRRRAQEFAARYPKIASRLLLSGEAGEDPHVERLLQSFALLTARISKKLDDDFPEFTEALLEVLYPHYLQPFPSCSIAHFDAGTAAATLSAPVRIPRGTALSARPLRAGTCRFRTAYEVTLSPLMLSSAALADGPEPSQRLRGETEATQVLSLAFETRSPQLTLDQLGLDRVRIFLDGDGSIVSQIREALFVRNCGEAIETEPGQPWRPCDAPLLSPVGFDDADALLDADARAAPAGRLLTEYFAFPDKFSFVDLHYAGLRARLPPGCRRFELKVLLRPARHGGDSARQLERITAANLRLGCTPVVNLFRQHAEPIRLDRTRTRYPLLPDARRAAAFEVHRVESVRKVGRSTAQGETVVEYRPFYSLRHAERFDEKGRFWALHRDEDTAQRSPGHEYELSIVDFDGLPADETSDTLSIELSCTNRDLPSQLPFGIAGGDLFVDGGSLAREIRLLRRPTPSWRFERGGGARWRLVSQLAIGQLALTEAGCEALKEALLLHDLPRHPANRRQIDGIVAITHRPSTAMMAGQPFPVFVRGVDIELTVDEDSYVGTGCQLFASLLEHYFAQAVHCNSYTRLILRSARDGGEILRCAARNGRRLLA